MVQMPLIEIPPTSMANHLLRKGQSTEMPRGLALWGGFGDLRQYRLIDLDEEARIWGGFGNTNLGGLILRKRKGTWTAVRLTGGLAGTKLRPSKRVFASPRSGWPAFWRRIEALGLWSLPDDSTLSPKGRKVALDGFSYLVEIQRHGVYRAYAYDNPESQTQWPEAERMVWIGRLLDREFPYRIP